MGGTFLLCFFFFLTGVILNKKLYICSAMEESGKTPHGLGSTVVIAVGISVASLFQVAASVPEDIAIVPQDVAVLKW